ncbi:hypothetical protein FNV43_RR02499 [Rhamnella rubrinervis]|uniref:Uncharacterized protein n=1 Tax=Rhamnella rubrinervis TaxID=2594499 RepID=A0A8K0HSQ0_9ROSA|nr:hypothetical protein FNV43_RR02499 [Rhamnella rubrinervis]
MDDECVNAQNDGQGNEDSLHNLKKDRELSKEGSLNLTRSKSKRLVRRANLQHALLVNVKQSSQSCIRDSFFKSISSLDSRIPKRMVSVDEKYFRRCLELIHFSATKTARCNISVNLSSAKMGVFSDSTRTFNMGSVDTFDSASFVFKCPSDAGIGTEVITPAGQWILGTIMGSKSMINIMKSPLFHKFGAFDSNTNFGSINSNDVNDSICYDFMHSPSGLTLSSPQKLGNDSPIMGKHKYGPGTPLKSLISMSSTNSACSDQSSSSASATVTQGMLQCTWKGGNPHFVFSTDDQREIYVANLWKVESRDEKGLDYIYLFHSGKSGQKSHEIRDRDSHLVGKMKVSNSFTLCPNNSNIMETEFVLFGGNENGAIEMPTSSHNLRKSKGLSKKVVEVFRTSHSSKLKTSSKLSRSSATHEISSTESGLDIGDKLCSIGGPTLSEEHPPPNIELAAIIVKDHVPETQKEEVGGWGLKFLKKVGVKHIVKSKEASVPSEYCQTSCDCSTTMDILIPAGLHGGPRTRNGGPSSLIERWRSGGHCDCGGWDMGCPLTILKPGPRHEVFPQANIEGECKSFDFIVQGSERAGPPLRIVNVHDDFESQYRRSYNGPTLRYVKANGERKEKQVLLLPELQQFHIHIHAIDVMHPSERILYSLLSPTAFLFKEQCAIHESHDTWRLNLSPTGWKQK